MVIMKKQKRERKMSKILKREKGITLIALVVTIIVLLILAGVTIATLTGDNGILNQAGNAKEQNEISNEKEVIEMATVQAMGKNKYGELEEGEFQKALDKQAGEGKTEVTDIGEEFEIVFKESNRYYDVDKDGNIGDYEVVISDKKPGNIATDKDGNLLDGSKDKPYEINCIEDLVVLSNIVSGKGNYIDLEGNIIEATRNIFSGKNFVLTRNLNFKSTRSYADLTIKWSYDKEEGVYRIDENSTTNLKEIITDKNGVGFVAIGSDDGVSQHFFQRKF